MSRDPTTSAFDRYADLVDRALRAHAEGDYAEFQSCTTAAFQSKVPEASFKKAHSSLGHIVRGAPSRRHLGAFRRGGADVLLMLLAQPDSEDEILVQLTIVDTTDGPKLDAMWIE